MYLFQLCILVRGCNLIFFIFPILPHLLQMISYGKISFLLTMWNSNTLFMKTN